MSPRDAGLLTGLPTRLATQSTYRMSKVMDVATDGSGEVFELSDISRPHDDSNRPFPSDHGDVRNSSSTLGDGLDDPVEQLRKEGFVLYTPEEEQAVIRKLDRRLVLFVAFLYMLSFLDRSSTPPAGTFALGVGC